MILTEFKAWIRLPSARGRDYVIGDLHGCAHLVRGALEEMGFDFTRDRLICVGDLVDRGPFSELALDLLAEPWCFSIRGNHEQMAIDYCEEARRYGETLMGREDAIANGMGWFLELAQSERERYARVFEKLPYAIEVQTERGLVGVVHAQTPAGWDWRLFLERLDQGDPVAIHHALWEREKIKFADQSEIEGVGRLYSGHTPLRAPVQLGNQFFMDTGGVFRVLGALTSDELGFTIAPIMLNAEAYHRPIGPRPLIGALEGEEDRETLFSNERFQRYSAFGDVEPSPEPEESVSDAPEPEAPIATPVATRRPDPELSEPQVNRKRRKRS